jgi:hypothetical protein
LLICIKNDFNESFRFETGQRRVGIAERGD